MHADIQEVDPSLLIRQVLYGRELVRPVLVQVPGWPRVRDERGRKRRPACARIVIWIIRILMDVCRTDVGPCLPSSGNSRPGADIDDDGRSGLVPPEVPERQTVDPINACIVQPAIFDDELDPGVSRCRRRVVDVGCVRGNERRAASPKRRALRASSPAYFAAASRLSDARRKVSCVKAGLTDSTRWAAEACRGPLAPPSTRIRDLHERPNLSFT